VEAKVSAWQRKSNQAANTYLRPDEISRKNDILNSQGAKVSLQSDEILSTPWNNNQTVNTSLRSGELSCDQIPWKQWSPTTLKKWSELEFTNTGHGYSQSCNNDLRKSADPRRSSSFELAPRQLPRQGPSSLSVSETMALVNLKEATVEVASRQLGQIQERIDSNFGDRNLGVNSTNTNLGRSNSNDHSAWRNKLDTELRGINKTRNSHPVYLKHKDILDPEKIRHLDNFMLFLNAEMKFLSKHLSINKLVFIQRSVNDLCNTLQHVKHHKCTPRIPMGKPVQCPTVFSQIGPKTIRMQDGRIETVSKLELNEKAKAGSFKAKNTVTFSEPCIKPGPITHSVKRSSHNV